MTTIVTSKSGCIYIYELVSLQTVIAKRISPFNCMKLLKRVYCLIQKPSQGLNFLLLSLNYNVYVFSDDEEMMNAENVEDEVVDGEQQSGSSRTDQDLICESRSLVGRSSIIYNLLLTMTQVVRRLKLYVV